MKKKGGRQRRERREGRGRRRRDGLDDVDVQRQREEVERRERERGGGDDEGEYDSGWGREEEEVVVGAGLVREEEEGKKKILEQIDQGAKDLRRMLWRITRLEEQRELEEALRAETPAGMRLKNAKIMAEIDVMREQIDAAEREQLELEEMLHRQQYAIAKSR